MEIPLVTRTKKSIIAKNLKKKKRMLLPVIEVLVGQDCNGSKWVITPKGHIITFQGFYL